MKDAKKFFTAKELNPAGHPVNQEIELNLNTLIDKLSIIRALYNRPMIVTNGLRDKADMLRIYKNRPESRIPWGSMHLIGAAADIADRDKSLAKFCFDNVQLLEDVGLWVEDPTYTHSWCHLQIYPPKSGNRFFKP